MAYLMFLLGSLIWLLSKLQSATNIKGFSIGVFLIKNLIPLIINIIFGFGFIYAGVSLQFELFGIDFKQSVWLIVGAAGQLLFRKIMKNAFKTLR